MHSIGRCYERWYGSAHKCVSSKSALLILVCSFIVGVWYGITLNPDVYLKMFTMVYTLAAYGFVAVVLCFFPLAGCLADTYGRHDMVVMSMLLMLISVPLLIVIPPLGLIDTYVTLVCFTTNVVLFGMDQLRDSSEEEKTVFIHWYVWTHFATILICQAGWSLIIQFPYNLFVGGVNLVIGICLLLLTPLLMVTFLSFMLCKVRCRREWIQIEQGGANPCKLIYRVTKYAYQQETPVQYTEVCKTGPC